MESVNLEEPGHFMPGNNPGSDWDEWKKYLNFYMAANKITIKNDEIKVAALLKFMGREGIEIFNTFEFTSVNGKIEYDEVIKKFDDVYGTIFKKQRDNFLEKNLKTFRDDAKLSVMQERYLFNSIIQKEGEPFDNFFLRIKTRAVTCFFEESQDSLIRDRIILGVNSETLRKTILRKKNLDLNEVIKLCRSYEKLKLELPLEKNGNKCKKQTDLKKESLNEKKKISNCEYNNPNNSCLESDLDEKHFVKKSAQNIDYNAKYSNPPSEDSELILQRTYKSLRDNKSYKASAKPAKILTEDYEVNSESDQKNSNSTKSARKSREKLKNMKPKRKHKSVRKEKPCKNNISNNNGKLDSKLDKKNDSLVTDETLRVQKSKLGNDMIRSHEVRSNSTEQSRTRNNKVFGLPESSASPPPKYHKSVEEIELENIQQRHKLSSKKSHSRRNISDSTKLRTKLSNDECVDSSKKIASEKLHAISSKRIAKIKEREKNSPEDTIKSASTDFQSTSLALYCSTVNCNSSECYKLHVNDEYEDTAKILNPSNKKPEYAQRTTGEKILKNESYRRKDVLFLKKTNPKRSHYEKEPLKKRKIFTKFKMDSKCIVPSGYQLKPIRSEVVDLKKELRAKGLSSAGNKEELIERLKMNLSSTESSMSEIDALHDNIDSDLLDDEDGLEEELDEMEEEEVLKKTAEDELKSLQSALEKDGMTEPSFSSIPLEQRKSRKITLIRHSAIPTLEDEEEKKALESPRDLDFKPEAPKTVAASTSDQVNGGQRKIIKLNCNLSNEERMKLRAQKFGMAAEEEKKQARAIRFGLSSNVTSSVSSTDALKARAERFGVKTESDPERPKTEKELKMEARRIRFSSPEKTDEEKRKKIRAEKFKIQF